MDKRQDEVSAPHIVRQVAEEKTSMRIVAHVLNNRSAVSIAMCFFQLFCRGIRKTLQQEGAYVRVMSKNGIGRGLSWPAETKNQRHDDGENLRPHRPSAAHLSHSNPMWA